MCNNPSSLTSSVQRVAGIAAAIGANVSKFPVAKPVATRGFVARPLAPMVGPHCDLTLVVGGVQPGLPAWVGLALTWGLSRAGQGHVPGLVLLVVGQGQIVVGGVGHWPSESWIVCRYQKRRVCVRLGAKNTTWCSVNYVQKIVMRKFMPLTLYVFAS